QERHRAEIGRDAINTRTRNVPRIAGRAARGIGKVDRAIGFHDDVVRPPNALPGEIIGDNRNRTVGIDAHDAPRVALAGDGPPLKIARESFGVLGALFDHCDALPGRVLHAPVVADVAEEEIAAFLPPPRAFGGPAIAAITFAQDADLFGRRNN